MAPRLRSPLPPMLTTSDWFRSSLLPLPASLLPLLLSACVVDSSKKQTAADTTHLGPVITVTPVNRGTAGMAERLLWTFSPNHKAILVVADPGGVENEPVPNGFFFGDEASAFQTQMDSVWDVAPSPNWKWIGFARAVDNEPSQTWAALDPTTGALHGTLPSNAGLADVKFTGGPTLDRSLPI